MARPWRAWAGEQRWSIISMEMSASYFSFGSKSL
jgi:hypothetical protein